ncbi:MAG: DUF3800 domain-containing protein [Spirochaetia bacterium]
MVLIYIDESGDTGTNFNDPEQPVFVLGAMMITQEKWKELEKRFQGVFYEVFNGKVPDNFELHTTDMVSRRKLFAGFSLEYTIKIRDELFRLIETMSLPIFYRKIDKRRYWNYCQKRFGSGIKLDPYIMAFPFISLKVDAWLKEENELGIFIFDEHRSLIDIEQSLKSLRLPEKAGLHVDRVIEKGFFVDSIKSFPLQIIDFVLYYIRKYEEFSIGKRVSEIHKQVFPYIERIALSLDQHEKGWDIIDWIEGRIQK